MNQLKFHTIAFHKHKEKSPSHTPLLLQHKTQQHPNNKTQNTIITKISTNGKIFFHLKTSFPHMDIHFWTTNYRNIKQIEKREEELIL